MKRLIAVGGGDMKEKTTIKIDEYAAELAKAHAGDKRAYALFIGTASHDCMPAFNTFRKTYTSVFDIKADCLLTVNVQTPDDKIDEKLSKADLIYIGGGDTLYMLDKWRERGLTQKIIEKYEQGVTIIGRSAGAICWFERMYTDTEILRGTGGEYKLTNGLGVIKGTISPHYNHRREDFKATMLSHNVPCAYAVEDDAALVFTDGEFSGALTSGGSAYFLTNDGGSIIEKKL